MSVERTPQGQGQGQGQAQASGSRATPDFTFAGPPPAPVVMSPDQFKSLIDRIPSGQAAPGQAEGGQDYGPNVSSVSVKLPTFWINDPELWFLQVESVFATRTPPVTRDITKFDHVVTALPTEALNAVFNVIRMPRATPDRYEQLKRALRLTYGKTQAQRHIELIEYAATKEPVLDVKPSNMLMYIKDLIGDSKEAFERAVFLNRLPNSVRSILASSTATSNEALALEANQIMEAFLLARPGCTPASVMAMESVQPPYPSSSAVASSSQAVAFPAAPPPPLPCQISAVSQHQKTPNASFLCFIHAKYGPKAYSCKSKQCPMHHLVQKKQGNSRAGR